MSTSSPGFPRWLAFVVEVDLEGTGVAARLLACAFAALVVSARLIRLDRGVDALEELSATSGEIVAVLSVLEVRYVAPERCEESDLGESVISATLI